MGQFVDCTAKGVSYTCSFKVYDRLARTSSVLAFLSLLDYHYKYVLLTKCLSNTDLVRYLYVEDVRGQEKQQHLWVVLVQRLYVQELYTLHSNIKMHKTLKIRAF